MDEILNRLEMSIKHLEILNNTFALDANMTLHTPIDHQNYTSNLLKFNQLISNGFIDELYKQNDRQMILADLIEYVFFGRMYLNLRTKKDKENFTKAILSFVNILMTYETLTVNSKLRYRFLSDLGQAISQVNEEDHFSELRDFVGRVGLTEQESEASKNQNKYFDSLLPKTAGGLWHELLVFIFMLRSDFGHIIPLLLSQRLVGHEDHIVPPDFLVLGKDKRLYGVEVGTKKEIQSGSFSIRSGIPTATIDTINSRTSDRCPICKKWILFCPYVIDRYSNYEDQIEKPEIRCLECNCNFYSVDEISNGMCRFTKYSRNRTKTLVYTHHEFANKYHFHYQCVLEKVDIEMREIIIKAKDSVALKTHFPYYTGLEYLK